MWGKPPGKDLLCFFGSLSFLFFKPSQLRYIGLWTHFAMPSTNKALSHKKKPNVNTIQKHISLFWTKSLFKIDWGKVESFLVIWSEIGLFFLETLEICIKKGAFYQHSVEKPASLTAWGCISLTWVPTMLLYVRKTMLNHLHLSQQYGFDGGVWVLNLPLTYCNIWRIVKQNPPRKSHKELHRIRWEWWKFFNSVFDIIRIFHFE